MGMSSCCTIRIDRHGNERLSLVKVAESTEPVSAGRIAFGEPYTDKRGHPYRYLNLHSDIDRADNRGAIADFFTVLDAITKEVTGGIHWELEGQDFLLGDKGGRR